MVHARSRQRRRDTTSREILIRSITRLKQLALNPQRESTASPSLPREFTSGALLATHFQRSPMRRAQGGPRWPTQGQPETRAVQHTAMTLRNRLASEMLGTQLLHARQSRRALKIWKQRKLHWLMHMRSKEVVHQGFRDCETLNNIERAR